MTRQTTGRARQTTSRGGIVLAVVCGLLLGGAVPVAGQLQPDSGPQSAGSQMPTLNQIYNRLDSGASSPVQGSFAEPAAAPTATTMFSLNDIMAAAPAVDAVNGATTDDVATSKTFWGLLSGGGWGTLTGTGFTIAATGQTTSYATRDDGALQLGATASPRFTDNANGTVTDNLTGLIWLKNANCFGLETWTQAISQTNALASGSCGLTDGSAANAWRLPNIRELASLIDYSRATNPVVPTGHPFTSLQSSDYWSSTTYAPDTSDAWHVGFDDGVVGAGDKTSLNYVWPVR